jgi:hypothetical protein
MFLCLIKHRAMKKYWGVEAKFQANYFPYSWISVVQRVAHSMQSFCKIAFLVLITSLILKLLGGKWVMRNYSK